MKFVVFCPKISRDSYEEFEEKTTSGKFFINFVQTKATLPKLVKFRPTFCKFFLGPYCLEKVHTSTFICCLHPGKETLPQTNKKKKILGRKAKTFCFRKTNFVHSMSGT